MVESLLQKREIVKIMNLSAMRPCLSLDCNEIICEEFTSSSLTFCAVNK
jgi:hypothetical protein